MTRLAQVASTSRQNVRREERCNGSGPSSLEQGEPFSAESAAGSRAESARPSNQDGAVVNHRSARNPPLPMPLRQGPSSAAHRDEAGSASQNSNRPLFLARLRRQIPVQLGPIGDVLISLTTSRRRIKDLGRGGGGGGGGGGGRKRRGEEERDMSTSLSANLKGMPRVERKKRVRFTVWSSGRLRHGLRLRLLGTLSKGYLAGSAAVGPDSMIHNPAHLILAEPTSGLAPQSISRKRRLCSRISPEPITIFAPRPRTAVGSRSDLPSASSSSPAARSRPEHNGPR